MNNMAVNNMAVLLSGPVKRWAMSRFMIEFESRLDGHI